MGEYVDCPRCGRDLTPSDGRLTVRAWTSPGHREWRDSCWVCQIDFKVCATLQGGVWMMEVCDG